jgi:hypothetical protein
MADTGRGVSFPPSSPSGVIIFVGFLWLLCVKPAGVDEYRGTNRHHPTWYTYTQQMRQRHEGAYIPVRSILPDVEGWKKETGVEVTHEWDE